MPFCGGGTSFPVYLGGDDEDTQAAILDGLNAAHGTAYDVSEGSNVYAENDAYADALYGIWETNQRIANQFDPQRMTSMLPRWERIMKIVPVEGATESERRREVARRWARNGRKTTNQDLFDEIHELVGDVLVTIEYDTTGTALTSWPSGTLNPAAPWSSSISIARVHVEPTAGMTDDEFYIEVGKMAAVLDARLPAWATWMWWRNDVPSGNALLYLDHVHNLDNNLLGP